MTAMTRTIEPQFTLAPEQIELWGNKLEQDTGVQLGQLQTSVLSSQVATRMRELDLADADDYFAQVCADPVEWRALMDRLLVKETHFFRNRDALSGIKRFIGQRLNNGSLGKNFDVWSAGCASGEEAYSLAAALYDSYTLAPAGHYFSVTGLDVSHAALAAARAGVYSKTRLALASESELKRFFEPQGRGFKVRANIKDRVTFVRGNLCDIDSIPPMPMDVIVCLNVLIYFRRWRRRAILSALTERLKPGGLLIIGSGELPGWQHPKLTNFAMAGVQAYQLLQSHTVAQHAE